MYNLLTVFVVCWRLFARFHLVLDADWPMSSLVQAIAKCMRSDLLQTNLKHVSFYIFSLQTCLKPKA